MTWKHFIFGKTWTWLEFEYLWYGTFLLFVSEVSG